MNEPRVETIPYIHVSTARTTSSVRLAQLNNSRISSIRCAFFSSSLIMPSELAL